MPCGMSIAASPSTTSSLRSALTVSRSLVTPGMSSTMLMPSASSKMSAAGASASSGLCWSWPCPCAWTCASVDGRPATSCLVAMTSPPPSADLDLPRPGRLGPRGRDVQDAVPIPGLDVIRLHVLRQADHAPECTVEPLLAVPRGIARSRRLSLTGDGQHVLLDRHVDRLGVEAGREEIHLDLVGGDPNVHRRKGSARRGADAERPCPPAQHFVHFLLEAPELLDQSAIPGKLAT